MSSAAEQERRPLVAGGGDLRAVGAVGGQRRVEDQVDRLEARRLAVVGARLAAPLQAVPALVAVHARRQRPGVGMLVPLAALPPEPVVGVGAGARGDVERRVVDVAAVVERRVPVVRPVRGEAFRPEQQRRVVELVDHVVEAAADVERRLRRHHPHGVAGDAEPVAVAARQREEAAAARERVVLVEIGLEDAGAREHLQVVADVQVDALREVPVAHLLGDAGLQVVDVARQVRERDVLEHAHAPPGRTSRSGSRCRRTAGARPGPRHRASRCTGCRWCAPGRSAATG